MDSFSQTRVLIIDDDPVYIKGLTAILESINFSVEHSLSGMEGLAKTRETKPDLVICDVVLPDIDGVDLCYHIKTDDELKYIPIILVSGQLIEDKDKIRGYVNLSDDYFVKPVTKSLFITRLEYIMKKQREKMKLLNRIKELEEELNALKNNK